MPYRLLCCAVLCCVFFWHCVCLFDLACHQSILSCMTFICYAVECHLIHLHHIPLWTTHFSSPSWHSPFIVCSFLGLLGKIPGVSSLHGDEETTDRVPVTPDFLMMMMMMIRIWFTEVPSNSLISFAVLTINWTWSITKWNCSDVYIFYFLTSQRISVFYVFRTLIFHLILTRTYVLVDWPWWRVGTWKRRRAT